MKYPELAMFKFDGQIKNYIHWWGKFQKIHNDQEVPDENKFEYLLQATEGRVHEQVKKYPPSAGNYQEVINLICSRYGDIKTLTSYYVRQLSSIIKNSHEFEDLSSLYEELRSNICNLETLGLTSDKIAIIVPLIESSLPFDILTAWEEAQALFLSSQTAASLATDNELKRLMDFLSRKVESQEKARLKQQTVVSQSLAGNSYAVPAPLPATACLVNNNASQGNQNRIGHSPVQGNMGNQSVVHNPGSAASQGQTGNQSNRGKSSNKKKCIFCSFKNHISSECRKAQHQMTLEEKKTILASKEACFICLVAGHMAPDCSLMNVIRCILCNKRHYVIMCPEVDERRQKEKQLATTGSGTGAPIITQTHNCLAAVNQGRDQGMMKTMYAWVCSPDGRELKIRGLKDGASGFSYITYRIARLLRLPVCSKKNTVHCLFGGGVTQNVTHTVYTVKMQSLDRSVTHIFNLLGEDTICSNIVNRPSPFIQQKLEDFDITLSDNGTGNEPIDFLIGTDLEGWILTEDRLKIIDGLWAIRTTFGWILSGSLPETNSSACSVYNCLNVSRFWNVENDTLSHDQNVSPMITAPKHDSIHTLAECSDDASVPSQRSPALINYSIEDFWDLEVFGIADRPNEDAVKDFEAHITVNQEGRYEVPLPWQGDPKNLGTNYHQAKSRLLSLTRKLTSLHRYDDYNAAILQWESEGIIQEVIHDDGTGHYLCHHPVFKEGHTTKVRPVFDGSAKTETGFALNSLLQKGPNLIQRIPLLFNNFRYHSIGITSDIRKAFLQIAVRPADRKYLKFLWWDETRRRIKVFQHSRVVFGLAPSPFLLAATLNFHLTHHALQASASQLLPTFYVDNILSSGATATEVERFMSHSTKILDEARFSLHEWSHSINLQHSPDFEYNNFGCCQSQENIIPILGLQWDKERDELYCSPKTPQKDSFPVTKRKLLASIMSIYDPIGFTAPVTVLPKLILQHTWKKKLQWDEELPKDLSEDYLNWLNEMSHLSECRISRCFLSSASEIEKTQIHVFCDGSLKAYAACIFIRTCTYGQIRVNLITAKLRVTPEQKTSKKSKGKELTIPRIELLGAHLAAKLYDAVCTDIRFTAFPVYFWTDSTVVLAWLHRSHDWKMFVSNRVLDILAKTKLLDWRHVPGVYNPADLLSRGCDAKTLAENRWWNGPLWLYQPEEQWPSTPSDISVNDEALAEAKIPSLINLPEELFSKRLSFRTYQKTLRVLAWILRFTARASKRKSEQGELTGAEIDAAETVLVKLIQREASGTIATVKKQLQITKNENDLFCVQTKLVLGNISHRFKYPVLLPHSHHLIPALIQHLHQQLKHAGVTTVMAKLREHFWLTKARKMIKEVLRSCLPCQKLKVKAAQAPIAPLPPERFQHNKEPFENSGVDLAGPIHTRDNGQCWVVLYTCAIFRAVHLELVPSLSSDAFLLTFRRFMARRGRPSDMYSDNGTNFHGAENLLAKLDWTKIVQDTSIERIRWHFNPPASPWWGGFWERLVALVKNLLKRSLGRTTLSYDELNTVIIECENVINSRPLTYICENEVITPITPEMFLNVHKYVSTDLDLTDQQSIQHHVRQVQVVRQALRQRFQSEYLALLAARPTHQRLKMVQPGDVVLVSSDKLKRQLWPLAVVQQAMVGKDGHTRTFKLKLGNGSLIRPIDRLYPLEIQAGAVDLNSAVVIPDVQNFKTKVKASTKKGPNEASGQVSKNTVPASSSIPQSKSTRTRVITPPTRYRQ